MHARCPRSAENFKLGSRIDIVRQSVQKFKEQGVPTLGDQVADGVRQNVACVLIDVRKNRDRADANDQVDYVVYRVRG
jgi:hypothetical protein